MSTRLPLFKAGLAAAAALSCALTACTGSSKHTTASSPAAAPPASTSSSSTAAPKPKPKPKAAPAVNPFTGIGPVPKTPTIIAKIDDTAPGRPQVGIDQADIVYIEEAEGGLSRLAAVFGTNKPIIGYVRSTRPSDPDLFLQYGKITEVASGGGGDSLPRLRASGIKGWINDWSAPYYFRVSRYQSTYINLELNLAKVAGAVKTPRPKNIGLHFSTKLPGKGAVGTDIRTMVGSTPVEFKWDAKLHRYVRYIDGVAQRAADGRLVTAANVIVQVCTIVAHPADRDVNGMPSQFTFTVGRGTMSLFRGGRRFDGHWSRANLAQGTSFTGTGNKPLALSPGNTWIALVRPQVRTTGR